MNKFSRSSLVALCAAGVCTFAAAKLPAPSPEAAAKAAETAGVALKFEAAVAGGIPVIKGLREGAAVVRATARNSPWGERACSRSALGLCTGVRRG